jgi:hypothetical protein
MIGSKPRPPKLTTSGFQRCRTERQQGPAADRRGSEERSVGNEGDRCGHNDFLASHICFCESAGFLSYIYEWLTRPVGQTVFGTNFFSFERDGSTGRPSFAVSHQFWIYWALSVPLTVVTLALWFWWSS